MLRIADARRDEPTLLQTSVFDYRLREAQYSSWSIVARAPAAEK